MKKKYKIVSRKRFSIFVTFIFVIAGIMLLSFVSNNDVHSTIYKIDYEEIKIMQGDTLWDIALAHRPEKTDIRKVIYDIKKCNNMETGYIYPGDIIKIPVYK